jgi:penicillin-binding protein 1C
MTRSLRRRRIIVPAAAFFSALLVFWIIRPLPEDVFRVPYATILRDRDGGLMGARVAADGQWRFPPGGRVPDKYRAALLEFEDRRFFIHPGVDPAALVRSLWLNLRSGEIVSGGSTITMQVIRLSRAPRARTVPEKLIEMYLALRLDLWRSKEDILSLYADHAPYGGNTVGLEAAAWRWFGRHPDDLSWAEAALLAVLPNAPSLAWPGRNDPLLKEKRDRLLTRLGDRGIIDGMTLELSLAEPLPEAPWPLPDKAPHLLTRAAAEGLEGQSLETTIDPALQEQVNRVVASHHVSLAENRIFNAAVLVVDLETGEVLSYVGNTPETNPGKGGDVDIITALRSPGSTLKPFLYAALLSEGEILPREIVPDIPAFFGGFSPRNFHRYFQGVVPADRALIDSLNVPFSFLLQRYGYQKFYTLLEGIGLRLPYPADHYGLSLILGGLETSLWDLTALYAGLGRIGTGRFNDREPFFPHHWLKEGNNPPAVEGGRARFLQSAVWLTLDAMKDLERPEEDSRWDAFASSRRIAWKTGTSWGFRDAWAIGFSARYLVGVWVGNADGEGRPGLRGLTAAGPILFDVFSLLPFEDDWFPCPYHEMIRVPVCPDSGMYASPLCDGAVLEWVPETGDRGEPCPYHKTLHLDETGTRQVDSRTYPVNRMIHQNWFVLPPVQAWYFSRAGTGYILPPPPPEGSSLSRSLVISYPADGARVFIPREMGGVRERVVFEAAHVRPGTTVFWHLDGEYLGSTAGDHQFPLAPAAGEHRLLVLDETGQSDEIGFTVLEDTTFDK